MDRTFLVQPAEMARHLRKVAERLREHAAAALRRAPLVGVLGHVEVDESGSYLSCSCETACGTDEMACTGYPNGSSIGEKGRIVRLPADDWAGPRSDGRPGFRFTPETIRDHATAVAEELRGLASDAQRARPFVLDPARLPARLGERPSWDPGARAEAFLPMREGWYQECPCAKACAARGLVGSVVEDGEERLALLFRKAADRYLFVSDSRRGSPAMSAPRLGGFEDLD
jgi:hypothetical protein